MFTKTPTIMFTKTPSILRKTRTIDLMKLILKEAKKTLDSEEDSRFSFNGSSGHQPKITIEKKKVTVAAVR